MPTIVYQTNPATGVQYAYESVSYWDKDKKAPRSKRRYLGRVDPETGEIIKGRKNRRKGEDGAPDTETDTVRQLREELASRDAAIASLREELRQMTSRYEEAAGLLARIRDITSGVPSVK